MSLDVAWGDCDPARIVFYPRYFQWIDAGSHKLMAAAGMGQRHAAREFGTFGPPLVSAKCYFQRPITFGDPLIHQVSVSASVSVWRERHFTVLHQLLLRDNAAISRGHGTP